MYSVLYREKGGINLSERDQLERYQYLVDRYSQNLTKYDIKQLFERLRQKKGTITAATEKAEITRKTVHDWDKNSEDVKIATKRKILDASLEADFQGTIDYLVRKNAINYREILKRYINMTLDKITNLNDPHVLEETITVFEKYIKSHRGAILDTKTVSLEETINLINQKASSLGVQGIAKDIRLMNPQIITQKFIRLIEVFNKKTMFKDEIADKIGFPTEFVERACKAMSYVDPPDILDEETKRLLIMNTPGHPRLGMENIPNYISARKE